MRGLKWRFDSIRLTADGVVPLDLTCLSSLEAWDPSARRTHGCHTQRYCSRDRRLAQEERSNGSGIRDQRQPPAAAQCGCLWSAVVNPTGQHIVRNIIISTKFLTPLRFGIRRFTFPEMTFLDHSPACLLPRPILISCL